MTRGRGRGSAGRISKSSARGNSATHRNIPTIPIPTVTHQQGGTSSSSRPNHINQVQTSGPSSTPPIQTSGNSSTPPVYVEPSPMTPNQSNTVDEGISHNNAIGEGISTQSNAIGEGECNSSLAQQTLVFLSSTGLEPSRLCSEYKYENFKNELHPNGINWKGVPKELKEFYFGEFKKAFYWDSLIDREVKHLWGSKAARRYSDFICKIKKDKDIIQPDFVPKDVWDNWMELWKDPKCVKKSEINAKYRCGGGTAIAIGTHTGGSITIGEHRKRIAIEKGRDPTPSELHLHVHTHGHDEKSFVSERSRLVHEKYQQILQQQTQTQSDIDQSLAFYQAAGGEKKRRIYGLGSQEKYFYGLNLRAYSGSDASSSAAPVLTNHMFPVLAERVRGLIDSPSHVQDNHTDHPSAMAPPVPPPNTNINEVHASLSDDDLHSLVSQ